MSKQDPYAIVPIALVAGERLPEKPGTGRGEESRVATFIAGVEVGVSVENAAIGAGIDLPRLAELIEEYPSLRLMIVVARGKLERDLYRGLLEAAKNGKHMAAAMLLEAMRPIDAEIDDAMLAARAGTDSELTDEEIIISTDRHFAEEDD